MHQALYRKWRPRTFGEVSGQEHITKVLANEVATNRVNHAYLFCGSRGTGKTTCAKILAKAVNCEAPENGSPCNKCPSCLAIDAGRATDVLEMDAASNNGVEYIRDIRDDVVYSPSSLKMRVYIIDEVHMLSVSAFNALLKTLEEPPPQVIFILATTETQKIPATILSRCQRFDFRRIASPVIADRLALIAEDEGITIDRDAALMIAKLSSGGMRDSISLLELCAGAPGNIDLARVYEVSGAAGRELLIATAEAVLDSNIERIFEIVGRINSESKDMSVFFGELLSFYRDMLVVKSAKNAAAYLDLTSQEYDDTMRIAARFRAERIIYHCKLLDEALISMQRSATQKRLAAEMALVRMATEKQGSSYEALASRISALEDSVALGVIPQPDAMPSESAKNEESADAPYAEAKSDDSPKEKSAPLPFWMEVVKKFERYDPSAAPFLAKAGASICGTIVTVTVGDSFSKTILGRENVLLQLKNVIRTFDATVSEVKIKLVSQTEATPDDMMGELLSSI